MPPLFSGGNSGVLRRSTDVCELRTADFSESWVCEQAIEETRDSGFDSLASGQIALRWRIREKLACTNRASSPLRSPAGASVRSRPPREALGSSDHGPRLEDAHAEAKRSRVACGTRRGSAELGLLQPPSRNVDNIHSRLNIVRFANGPKRSIRRFLGGEKNIFFNSRY
jgi:hypothetical protein